MSTSNAARKEKTPEEKQAISEKRKATIAANKLAKETERVQMIAKQERLNAKRAAEAEQERKIWAEREVQLKMEAEARFAEDKRIYEQELNHRCVKWLNDHPVEDDIPISLISKIFILQDENVKLRSDMTSAIYTLKNEIDELRYAMDNVQNESSSIRDSMCGMRQAMRSLDNSGNNRSCFGDYCGSDY